MSYFFKHWLFLTIALQFVFTPIAFGIDIDALYRSPCVRELGLILYVDSYEVRVLTINGTVKAVPRHEIIYFASYPIDTVPMKEIKIKNGIQLVTIETLFEGQITQLVEGWPVQFTEENISFLTIKGKETVIQRDNIWKVTLRYPPKIMRFSHNVRHRYNFIHPYPFAHCKSKIEGNLKGRTVITVTPQQLFSDPVMIKRHLDHLQDGHKKIRDYNREQKFYAVPQVYKNQTSLGLWTSFGSRYGASKARSNNVTPILSDEISTGPFGYQQIFKSGSGPMPYSVHEEPQTQIYWRFKADYFHLSLMMDPNLFLIGSSYKWVLKDLDSHDDRITESFLIETGLDFGPISIQFYGISTLYFAFRYDDMFWSETFTGPRVGLRYQNHVFVLEGQMSLYKSVSFGNDINTENKSKFNFMRLNLSGDIGSYNSMGSFIYRFMKGKSSSFLHKSNSYTLAFYANRKVWVKYQLGGFAALETNIKEYGLTAYDNSETKFYPKGGINFSLSF